ncbi:PLP-dependent transferase, partial [Myriangium duriaei CBS 260.36]
VESFRDKEYPQLKGKIYLDTGGTMLYPRSLIEEFSIDLISNLYGNPHSASTPAVRSSRKVDSVREKALRFFNADPTEWDLIFTANATASVKCVAECMRDFAAASGVPFWYGYHYEAHTSLVGARELSEKHHCFSSDEEVEDWITKDRLLGSKSKQLGLFAYPAQSNMTGRRLSLQWPQHIRKRMKSLSTYSLLDAAALVSTCKLDLSNASHAPDFVALSFYKIFGFPNIGGLIVRKASAKVLGRRQFFGGGTVEMVVAVDGAWHAKRDTTYERLEDGTLPFHAIVALDHAIDVHDRLYGPDPMSFISAHTTLLVTQLYNGLFALRHANGMPLVIIYTTDGSQYGNPIMQGATIAFNVRAASGQMIGYQDVEKNANKHSIFLRSGQLCNPGGVATYLEWSSADLRHAYAMGHRCGNPTKTQVVLGKSTGVVRASIGAMNTAADIDAFLDFMQRFYV